MSLIEPNQIANNLERISELPLEEQLAEYGLLREQLEGELNNSGQAGRGVNEVRISGGDAAINLGEASR